MQAVPGTVARLPGLLLLWLHDGLLPDPVLRQVHRRLGPLLRSVQPPTRQERHHHLRILTNYYSSILTKYTTTTLTIACPLI